MKLSSKKLSAKSLTKSVDIHIKEIPFIINDCIEKGIFSDDIKLADVSPIFKQDSCKKENYRPVSTLSHMAKTDRILLKKVILSWLQIFPL